ncbi:uncharacterized protein [Arachis hypogaea]|uniref:uncharacterized protein isoform X2 n=2 Tax=Arachis hypogaea TaxID=3818 RepID=UPI000DEC055E
MISLEMSVQGTTASQQPQGAESAHIVRPDLPYLMSSQRRRYRIQCIHLQNAAENGHWKKAKKILEQDRTLLTYGITKRWETILHVAVSANRVRFVKELVNWLQPGDLALQDQKGRTAFCLAAIAGNVRIAEILRRQNDSLPGIRDREGGTPLHLAALRGRKEMARYLYPQTKGILQEDEWIPLFLTCVNSQISDVALEMLNEKETLLATARSGGGNNETALHALARRSSLCCCQNLESRKHLLHLCKKDTWSIKLVERIMGILISLDGRVMTNTMSTPPVTLIAAEVGNLEFLSVIMSIDPELVWDSEDTSQRIIRAAVLHRHASVFNLLIHRAGPIIDSIVTSIDAEGNNLLHCAAKLAPPDKLKLVSGETLQMMLESTWYKVVKKLMPPSSVEMRNYAGLTPRQLFTMEHEPLLKKGVSWMNKTAKACIIVSTLIFSACYSWLTGNNNDDNKGSQNDSKRLASQIFALADTVALMSSLASVSIFFSTVISRFSEEDFLKSLPLKLISGLVALFISIISMILAFSSTFFITNYEYLKWVPSSISGVAFLTIPLFVSLQFPLWFDMMYSAYISSSLS